jgi:hypothetical protein
MTNNELLYGSTEALPVQTILTAGPFIMIYENGFIRHIKYGDNEIIRMIYVALRDKNWGTYAPIIENENINVYKNSFAITYLCRYEENNKTIFSWNVHIEGNETGKIIFAIEGKALADLWKNRAGFCILHPIKDTAGQPITVTYQDGLTEAAFFPLTIAPQNPFRNITKLQWRHQQREYVIETEGDIFEMEDHRNWTDTSFKTFCTPLSFPYPVQIKTGDRIRQQICFYPVTALPVKDSTAKTGYITVTIDEGKNSKMPAIGICASTEIMHPSKPSIDTIKKIECDYYCIEVKSDAADWQQYLKNQLNISQLLATRLFITLELATNHEQEFAAFAELLVDCKENVQYILIIEKDQPVTGQQLIEWAEKNVKKIFPSVLLGIGTLTNFAELNRNRRTVNNIDFVSYAIHPQEHAFDNLSLVENVESQADTVTTAQQLYPDVGISISPVTLRRRINPYAQNNADREQTNEQKADPRQISLWAAGWTLASIKYLGEVGATTVTYFQTTGKQGICSAEGELYPVGILLEEVLTCKKATVIKTVTNKPLQCSSLLVSADDKQYLFLANHSNNTLRVKLPFYITTIDRVEVFPSYVSTSKMDETDVVELPSWSVVKLS